jgi:hypothetical protein
MGREILPRTARAKKALGLCLSICAQILMAGGAPLPAQAQGTSSSSPCDNFVSGSGATWKEMSCAGRTFCYVQNKEPDACARADGPGCCYNGGDPTDPASYSKPACNQEYNTLIWNGPGAACFSLCLKQNEVDAQICSSCLEGEECIKEVDEKGCWSGRCSCGGECPQCDPPKVCSLQKRGSECFKSCECPAKGKPPASLSCPDDLDPTYQYDSETCKWNVTCLPNFPLVPCPPEGQKDDCDAFRQGCAAPGLDALGAIGYCCIDFDWITFPRPCGECETKGTILYPCGSIPPEPPSPPPFPPVTPTVGQCRDVCQMY